MEILFRSSDRNERMGGKVVRVKQVLNCMETCLSSLICCCSPTPPGHPTLQPSQTLHFCEYTMFPHASGPLHTLIPPPGLPVTHLCTWSIPNILQDLAYVSLAPSLSLSGIPPSVSQMPLLCAGPPHSVHISPTAPNSMLRIVMTTTGAGSPARPLDCKAILGWQGVVHLSCAIPCSTPPHRE